MRLAITLCLKVIRGLQGTLATDGLIRVPVFALHWEHSCCLPVHLGTYHIVTVLLVFEGFQLVSWKKVVLVVLE